MLSVVYAQAAPPATLTGFEDIFANIISIFIPFASIVLFVLLVYGGIRYITSGANPRNVEGAKNIITYALLGVFLLAMAFLILRVIEQVTGANITTFQVRRF